MFRVLRSFSQFCPDFHGFCPDFKGFCPYFHQVKTFGGVLAPSPPAPLFATIADDWWQSWRRESKTLNCSESVKSHCPDLGEGYPCGEAICAGSATGGFTGDWGLDFARGDAAAGSTKAAVLSFPTTAAAEGCSTSFAIGEVGGVGAAGLWTGECFSGWKKKSLD